MYRVTITIHHFENKIRQVYTVVTRRSGSVYLGVDVLRVREVVFMCIRDVCSVVALYILGVG